MKICLIAPHYPPMSFPCGAAHFVQLLSLGLAKEGHTVTVLHSNPEAQSPSNKINLKHIKNFGYLSLLKLALSGFFKQFDIVDVQFELFMYQNKGAVLLLPLMEKKSNWILTLHSQHLPPFLAKLWRYLQMTQFKKVIFYSLPFLNRMKERLPQNAANFELQGFPSNIARINKGPIQNLLNQFRHKNSAPLGVYFGHINNQRGIEDLLFALLKLAKENIPYHFVFVGQFKPEEDAYHRDLLTMIKQQKAEGLIEFSKRVSDEEVSLILSSSDFAALPFPEGASLKNGSLSACLSHGVPAVTTETDLTDKPLLDCGALLTYTPGDKDSLYLKLKQICEQNDLRSQLSKKAQQFSEIYSWDSYLNKRCEIYQQVREGK